MKSQLEFIKKRCETIEKCENILKLHPRFLGALKQAALIPSR